jgi:hypothetical protein
MLVPKQLLDNPKGILKDSAPGEPDQHSFASEDFVGAPQALTTPSFSRTIGITFVPMSSMACNAWA